MRILYITQSEIDVNSRGLYADLTNSLLEAGHIITILEASNTVETARKTNGSLTYLGARIGDQFGVNFIKKGLVILTMEHAIKRAINKHLSNESFDLLIYATPPITFDSVVKYCKKKFNCKSYLMLKDIFPQNAVDIGLISKTGLSSILYKLFARKENNLYKQSDMIGCMSQGNVDYVIKHNPSVDIAKLEIFPNARRISSIKETVKDKSIFAEYGIPAGKFTFVFGGNLGKPQGLDFLAEGIAACKDLSCIFIIVGKGQDRDMLFTKISNQTNVFALDYLPGEEYNRICVSCDVGMIALDYRFTIPNYPSRLLSYLENSMPVFACTDKATDIKELLESDAKCGKWCYSNSVADFRSSVEWFIANEGNLQQLGDNGKKYLIKNFNTDICVAKLEKLVKVN